MIFETQADLDRELKAIQAYCKVFKGSYQKLDNLDIDFKVFDKEGKLLGYVEVKGRYRNMSKAYPLPIAAKKLVKLMNKRHNPVVIWACDDGILYANIEQLVGEIRWGGMTPREGAVNDMELMAYYNKQKAIKYIRYY